MLTDSVLTKNIPLNKRTKKISKKESDKLKFNNRKYSNSSNIDGIEQLSAINPFLFLQEIDEYKMDQEKLKHSGDKILKCLKDLRLDLISGNIGETNILKLSKIIENNNLKFKFPEFKVMFEDLILRSEVELAKIENAGNKLK